MRKKRWLTAGMAVIAAAAVIMAATSYNEIRKKLNMQCENQKTMLVAGYELQTENTEKEKDVESESSSGKKIQTKSEQKTLKRKQKVLIRKRKHKKKHKKKQQQNRVHR